MTERPDLAAAYEVLPPTPDCEPGVYCPFTDNGAYHGVCLWHEGSERTCTCDGRTAHTFRRPSVAWPLPPGALVYAVQATCDCGSQFFACPECGAFRCLHCDPIEVTPEREPSCHAE